MKTLRKVIVSVIAIVFLIATCWSIHSKVSPQNRDINSLYDATNSKVELTIATISENADLNIVVAEFNNNNKDCHITVLDYSDNGALSLEKAMEKLSTTIISGNFPDMICFSSLSPYPFISKHLLLDLNKFIDQDNQICLSDIAVSKAIDFNGNIYFVGNKFNYETIVGKYSEFGDRYGWTFSEYLGIEKTLPKDVEMIYNITKSSFLRSVSARYIESAIDWENGTCDFNNDEFIAILEASSRIRETPENQKDLDYSYPSADVASGKLVTSMLFGDSVFKLAFDEKMAGCQLSYIGWPTVDGSCGSDIYLHSPIGITIRSKHPDECWSFLKYMMMNVDEEDIFSLPVYLPALQKMVKAAINNKELPVQMDEKDAEQLYSLISNIENVAFYDETVLKIITQEGQSYLNGSRTAEETASIIQSKVSIYVSEQG